MRAALFLFLALLAGCADRGGSIEAAEALAEANYPGQLELHATALQKDHYDVIFAVKGDPITRIRFGVDRDPARCRQGTPCEARLRKAHAEGVAAGRWLATANRAFRRCGVPLLAVEGAGPATHMLVVELDLGETDQQPALDRLQSCVEAFRVDGGAGRHLRFRILRGGGDEGAAMPELVTFETRLPRDRAEEPSYRIAADLLEQRIPQERLGLYGPYVTRGPVADRLAAAAQTHLATHMPQAEVGRYPLIWGSKLDPRRLDRLRTYVLACGTPDPAPCRKDVAVGMSYDLRTGEASAFQLLEVPRDRGVVRLPALAGR